MAAKRKQQRRTPAVQRPVEPPGRPTGVRPSVAALLILATGVWAYSNSFNGAFVLDDIRAIVQNESIRSLSPIADAFSPPPRSTVAGRPLANFTFAVNYAISELGVRSYHVANLLIHLAAALALFGVVRRTLLSPRLRDTFAGHATWVAAGVAIVWVVHPLTTAAVTYVVQRVESLMSLFYLLTLYCAIRASDGERRTLWTIGAVASCALGMATKEVMVTAPVAVALWDDVFRLPRRPRVAFLLSLATTWILFALLVTSQPREASLALSPETAWRYLLTQAEVLTHYLALAFVPSRLVFLYTWPLVTGPGDVVLAGLLMLALLAATIVGLVKRHPAAFPAAAFFLILAPTSSVIPIVTEVAAEQRMYLPLAALIALMLSVVFLALRRFGGVRVARIAVASLALALAVAYGLTTRARNVVYVSDEALWADTVATDPDNHRARVALGSVLAQRGRIGEAVPHFRRAAELNDGDWVAHSRLGSALLAQGNVDDAAPHLERAIALNPEDIDAHRALGQLLAMQREDARALTHLEKALQAQPDNPQLVVQVASVLADSRDPAVRNPERAVTLAERGVELTSRREAMALDVLGLAYARQGRFVEAASAATDALAIARGAGNAAAAASIEVRLRAYEARTK